MTFGEKLQDLRRKAGLSQDALAERLDVSRQAVSKWERDDTMPETEKVVRIAQLFGVSLDYLLMDREENREPKAEPQPRYQQPQYQQAYYRSSFSMLGQLEKYARRHGYKAGYVLMSIGAVLCVFSLVMYFAWPAIGNSFFGGNTDSHGMPQIQIQGDVTPEMEAAIIDQLIKDIPMDSIWSAPMSGMMNSALKAQASLFLIAMLPGIAMMAAGGFIVYKGKKFAAEAAL